MIAVSNYLNGGYQIHLIEYLVACGLTYNEVMNTYEETMGYPIGYTALNRLETPLSHK